MCAECARAMEVEAAHDGRLGRADVSRLRRHLEACASCRALRDALERVRAQLREDLVVRRSELAVRHSRHALLAAAAKLREEPSVLPRKAFGLAAIAAVVALAGVAARRTETRPTLPARAVVHALATVEASAAARWSRASTDDLERVRLRDGVLRVTVPHQRRGHRFVVELPDGLLEVRGTCFVVAVAGGATERVEVTEGLVELRVAAAPTRLLAAGERWERAEPVVTAPVVLARRAEPLRGAARTAPRETPTSGSDYTEGIAALDRGDFGAAARRFAAFEAAHPGDDRAEDAAFLRVIAVRRAEGDGVAEPVARRYLARYADGSRRWDASLVVARACVTRGACAAAREALDPFVAQPSRGVAVRAALGPCATSP